ncbi:MAG: hypothetical protein NC238_06925 [Dehalobacter sp.]|nr:hypothetical protein [Dehalobacter sp.]
MIEELATYIIHEESYLSVTLLSLEVSSISEMLRKACEQEYNSWINVFTKKLIQGGFTAEKAQKLAVLIQSMIDGAVTLSVTKKDTAPLQIAADSISLLLIS